MTIDVVHADSYP